MSKKIARFRIIDPQVEQYLLHMIDSPSNDGKKIALQRLTDLYRAGYTCNNPHGLHQRLHGLLVNPAVKVRRWTFALLALAGIREHADAIVAAISTLGGEPELCALALTALISIDPSVDYLGLASEFSIDLDGAAGIAMAQTSPDFAAALQERRVNIDKAGYLDLRFASVLIGVGKAPQNIFDIKHPNENVIGRLNGHEDDLVAQYSVWAISANPSMNASHLCIDTKDIPGLRPNVRGWVYRVISKSPDDTVRYFDQIVEGTSDDNIESRLNLAAGLREVFVDGLGEIMLGWLIDESDDEVRSRILEHMARHNERFAGYSDAVTQFFRDAGPRSILSERMLAACGKTKMFSELKRIEFGVQNPQLDLGGTTINMNQKFDGNYQIGAVVGSGDVKIGDISMHQHIVASDIEKVVEVLKAFLAKGELDPAIRAEGEALVSEIAAQPNPSTFAKLAKWLSPLKDGATVINAIAAIGKFGVWIGMA